MCAGEDPERAASLGGGRATDCEVRIYGAGNVGAWRYRQRGSFVEAERSLRYELARPGLDGDGSRLCLGGRGVLTGDRRRSARDVDPEHEDGVRCRPGPACRRDGSER
jgi:hypothetical protein